MILTLADLEFKYKQIYDELEENGGEVTEELQDALAINENDFEDRIENYYMIISQNDSDVERLQGIIKRTQAKIKAKENVTAYLKEIIKKAAKTIILPEKTKAGLLTYKKDIRDIRVVVSPSQAVDITDLQKVADAGLGKYKVAFNTDDIIVINRIKRTFPNIEVGSEFQPDKTTISNKLKAKEKVEGAELQTNYGLTFK